MIVKLQILTDEGNPIVEVSSTNPEQPLQWKAPPGHPVVVKKESGSVYKLWSLTVTPTAILEISKGENIAPRQPSDLRPRDAYQPKPSRPFRNGDGVTEELRNPSLSVGTDCQTPSGNPSYPVPREPSGSGETSGR